MMLERDRVGGLNSEEKFSDKSVFSSPIDSVPFFGTISGKVF